MNSGALFFFLLQAFLTGCAICMGIWAGMPWLGTAGLGLLALSLMVGQFASVAERQRLSKGALAAAWLFALLVPCILLWAAPAFTLDSYYAIIAWVVAASVLPACNLVSGASLKKRWLKLAMVWVVFGNCIWIAYAYTSNSSLGFHVGLGLMVLWLMLWKVWFRPEALVIQVLNTLLLVCVGLPVADLFLRPSYRFDTRPQTGINYYSYARARKNPTAFAQWWQYYLSQWNQMGKTVFAPDPEGRLPFRLRPGAAAPFFESQIRINTLGFRGKEVPFEKGNAYRIIAIGESTTFGCTLRENDETWPCLLEQMIAERLKPARPVQVINAGVPSYNLEHNLRRFAKEILPLQPDMIISYHGYNGFELVNDALPPPYGITSPAYQARPLKLLADCEHRLKLQLWKKRQVSELDRRERKLIDPMKTKYAEAFRELIRACETNQIALVLSTFSMAANGQSEPDLVEFYRDPFFAIHWQIEANEVLSTIVRELTRDNSSLCLVDTQPLLDGKDKYFIDLVHFTQPGRNLMAETFFLGIEGTLKKVLPGQIVTQGH
jgi:hypothetical protein